MKKALLLVSIAIIGLQTAAAQSFITQHAQKLAAKITQVLKDNLPTDKELTIKLEPFTLTDEHNDSIINSFALKFYSELNYYLQKQLQNKGLKFRVLPTNKDAIKIINQHLDANNKTYLDYVKKNKANIFIEGSYNLKNYTFNTFNVRILYYHNDYKTEVIRVPDMQTKLSLTDKNLIYSQKNFNDIVPITQDIKFSLYSLRNKLRKVLVYPLTFKITQTPNNFSIYFHNVLLSQLSNLENFTIKDGNIPAPTTRGAFSRLITYHLTGEYALEGDKIHLFIKVINPKSNRVLFSNDYYLDANKYRSIIDTPSIITEVGSFTDEIEKYGVTTQDFKFTVLTNKGDNNVVYYQGDTLWLYVQTSEPAYVRMIYIMADGTKILLLDDYIDQPNKLITLPRPEDNIIFVCSPPFGKELLYAMASNKSFPKLNTKRVPVNDGYINIILDELKLTNTRGFITKPRNLKYAEKKIYFLTKERK